MLQGYLLMRESALVDTKDQPELWDISVKATPQSIADALGDDAFVACVPHWLTPRMREKHAIVVLAGKHQGLAGPLLVLGHSHDNDGTVTVTHFPPTAKSELFLAVAMLQESSNE